MTTVTSVLIDVADGAVTFVASGTVAGALASGTVAGNAVAGNAVASAAGAGATGVVRPLLVRRCRPTVGPAYWRWDCRRCGEYGGGEHHPGAVVRALRHCAEHPEHRSALLRPLACRQQQRPTRTHPVLLDPAAEADAEPLPAVPLR